MKKVLIIAYYFPPSGGPGVQRVLKYTKYLREFGWEPIIHTVSNGQYPAIDNSLIEEIPEYIKVYKSKIFEPYDIYRFFMGKSKNSPIDVNVIKKEGQKSNLKEKIVEFIRATFFIPDARIGWYFSALKQNEKIFKENKIDIVYSSSPPYTCSLIAKNIQKKYNIPWIAGFRDPWTDFISSPNRWFLPKMIDKTLEKSVFENSNLVECAWLGIIKDALAKYPDLDSTKFIHIPNGFDSEEFPKYEIKENEKFLLTYTGSLYGRRNPKELLKVIAELINENKVDKNKIILRFIGRFGTEVEEMFKEFPYQECLEIISYVTHRESIAYLMQSDVNLLIVDESKESEEIVPGKVYEYLGVKKAILAIGPEKSAIADLLLETNGGLICHQSNLEKLKENFLLFYTQKFDNSSDLKANFDLIDNYERKNLTKQFAKYLDKLCNFTFN